MDTQFQFNYVLSGDRHCPKILLIHGFMGSCRDFEPTIASLPNFCCLAIDLPDHGRTKTSEPNYQMSDIARGIIALLIELEFIGCTLVGYSLGGRIALYLAVHFAPYFQAVVLESASPGLPTQLERDRRIVNDLQLARRLETENLADFLHQWYQNPLFDSFRQHPNYPQAISQRLNNNPHQLARSLRQIGLGRQPNLAPFLGHIQLPLLLIVGKLDHKFVAIATTMANSCPQATFQLVPNAGHNVHLEHLAEFCRRLKYFVAKVQLAANDN